MNMDVLWNFLGLSERASVQERVVISLSFMALVGQVEVMKIRAGIPFSIDMGWVTWAISLILFTALWGTRDRSLLAFVRHVVLFFAWTALSETIRFGMAYLMTVVLFPGPELVVAQ